MSNITASELRKMALRVRESETFQEFLNVVDGILTERAKQGYDYADVAVLAFFYATFKAEMLARNFTVKSDDYGTEETKLMVRVSW